MSKRKPAKSSKRARSPAIATRAHGKKQAVVKSARDNLLRSVAAGPIESPLELHDDPKEEAPNVEKQEAPIAANPVQVGPSQMRGFDFASATGNMVAYQAKLLEMTQANMRFALDFSQKLATIRSPFQFVDVIVEFTNRRADMLGKQSTEMAALTRRWLQAVQPRRDRRLNTWAAAVKMQKKRKENWVLSRLGARGAVVEEREARSRRLTANVKF